MSNLTDELQKKNNNYNIEVTLGYAREEFAQCDPGEVERNTGFQREERGFTVPFADQKWLLTYPEGIVTDLETGAEIPDNLQVLVMHHAIQASAARLTGKKISYKELPGGDIYIDPFTGRCIRPLIGIFAADLEAFERAVSLCPGQKETLGDSSYTVFAMPKVPITLVLYAADEEFPANGNILFDAAAAHFLSTEDYAVLCSALVGRLKKLAFVK